jgi:hypothetical protein
MNQSKDEKLLNSSPKFALLLYPQSENLQIHNVELGGQLVLEWLGSQVGAEVEVQMVVSQKSTRIRVEIGVHMRRFQWNGFALK